MFLFKNPTQKSKYLFAKTVYKLGSHGLSSVHRTTSTTQNIQLSNCDNTQLNMDLRYLTSIGREDLYFLMIYMKRKVCKIAITSHISITNHAFIFVCAISLDFVLLPLGIKDLIILNNRSNQTIECKKAKARAERELAARKRDDARKAKDEVKSVK